MAEAVASKTLPDAVNVEVNLAISPAAVGAPKTWKAEPVAVPPTAKSKVELAGERILLFNCQKPLILILVTLEL